jgi:hypothetical protein
MLDPVNESDPAVLLELAGKCHRLAETMSSEADFVKLKGLAQEYERKARAVLRRRKTKRAKELAAAASAQDI